MQLYFVKNFAVGGCGNSILLLLDLLHRNLSQLLYGNIPHVQVSNSLTHPWNFSIVEPYRENIYLILFEGSGLRGLPFMVGPTLFGIVFGYEHYTK